MGGGKRPGVLRKLGSKDSFRRFLTFEYWLAEAEIVCMIFGLDVKFILSDLNKSQQSLKQNYKYNFDISYNTADKLNSKSMRNNLNLHTCSYIYNYNSNFITINITLSCV